jgi:hypothetical protein
MVIGVARSEGFRLRVEKTVTRAPGEDKPLPGLIIRGNKATVADEDIATVTQLLDACCSLGARGLAGKVCSRFVHKLGGIVNHYNWIDSDAMQSNVARQAEISWPDVYRRDPCLSLKCHCTPLKGVPAQLPDIGFCGVARS